MAEPKGSESRYKKLVEEHPYGIHENDTSGTITYANPAYNEMFGFEAGEAIGTAIWALVPTEEGREQLRQYLAYLVREQPPPTPYVSETSKVDGTPILVRVHWNYLYDEAGELAGFISVSADVTEQKRTEEALRESQALLQAFLENFPDLVFAKDRQGRIILGNRKLDQMFGAEPGALIGKTVYDLVNKEAADAIWATEKRIFETGEPLEVEETVPLDDEIRTKYTVKFPLYDEAGNINAVGGITTDITDRKRAEAERARLQQKVIEAQQQALKELSTPIIPVMEGIIIMPLIGSIDTERAREITRAMLSGITKYRAQVVILDITGVSVVDSGVADHLNKTIQAARLKGSRTIVTGISDAVAETVVDLGIDWSDLDTVRDLQTGLSIAVQDLDISL